jgi:short-subunit dehydrogenase
VSACAPLTAEVEARGGRPEPPVADLSTLAGIGALLARAAELELELLVINAVAATYGPFASAPAERERGLVRLNVDTIVALTRGRLPQMLARGRAGVINVASQMAFQPTRCLACYAASTAFVLSCSEALAEELRGTGVSVTAVAPRFVRTEFTEVAGSREPERCLPHPQPRRVVESGLRAYTRGTITIMGRVYGFLTFAGRFAPPPVVRRIMDGGPRSAPAQQSPSPEAPPPRARPPAQAGQAWRRPGGAPRVVLHHLRPTPLSL